MANYLSNIYLDEDARKNLMIGVNGAVDAVKLTLGASGGNAILSESLYPFHSVTNDGKTIVERISFTDPVQNMGADLVKEIAQKSDKDSGDGTTTSCVLLQAILQEGAKVDASPMDIKRSLDECLPLIIASIDAQKKEITPDEVGQVATISSESESLGKLFQEMYQIVGRDGIVELDNNSIPETSYTITDGVRLHGCGFMYPYMANDDVGGVKKGKTAIYKNPKIVIAKDKIGVPEITKLMNFFKGHSITDNVVIFCDDIDQQVVEGLAIMHYKGEFKSLVIKAPTIWKQFLFEDFAKITGATIVDSKAGVSFKIFGEKHLGTCEQITTTKDESVVRGIADIQAHIESLKESDTDDDKRRLAWLQTKTAVLKLGANSESELYYLRTKAEDARNASYLALQDGIVAGGGLALLNASKELPDTVGGGILKAALQSPFAQIYHNATGHLFYETEVEQSVFGETIGFDAKVQKPVDMWKAGIVDPSKVVKNSIRNAISVAGTVLTTRVIVVEKPKAVI